MDCNYQCKSCNDRFKTTAELQKHKRLQHRNPTVVDNKSSLENKIKKETPVVAVKKPAPVAQRANDGPNSTGHGHGTRYSKARNSTSKDDDISLGKERHLTCASCSHNFDTKDPVVLHLLRQSRNENGTLKCPFCTKILRGATDLLSPLPPAPTPQKSKKEVINPVVENSLTSSDDSEDQNTNPTVASSSSRRSSRISIDKASNLSSSRSSFSSESRIDAAKRSARRVSFAPAVSVREPSLRVQNKRKSSPPKESPKPPKRRDYDRTSVVGHSENSCDSQSTPAAVARTPKVSPGYGSFASKQLFFSTSSPLVPVPALSDQLKRGYEITYRKPIGEGSRGGRRNNRGSRSNNSTPTTADDNSQNSMDAPLKVSVLINNNPFPSTTRLAVPKGKQFQKGNIRCPYCGFVAQSVREVQFHVNTHMAKSYPCEFCSHIYRSKQAVIIHIETHHPEKLSKLQVGSTDANNSVVEDDQRSMSNYSHSLESDPSDPENYRLDFNTNSQDSNTENSNDFPASATDASYYAPGDASAFNNGSHHGMDQYQDSQVITINEAGVTSFVKVLDVANF